MAGDREVYETYDTMEPDEAVSPTKVATNEKDVTWI